MVRKISYQALAVIIVAIVGFIFYLKASSIPHDTWVCTDGAWTKVGRPLSSMPNKICK